MRIQFFDESKNVVEAVYCEDFYADKIAAEANGTVTTTYFTENFVEPIDPALGDQMFKWVCPNITEMNLDTNYGLEAHIVGCESASGDVYADGLACDQDELQYWSYHAIVKPVSSNFDPYLYHKDGTIQLYYQNIH